MVFAAELSAKMLPFNQPAEVRELLNRYHLPTDARYSVSKVLSSLQLDKKRLRDSIDFILLQRMGQAIRKPISLKQLEERLRKNV
jgi:3-dehydroquinate synthase